MKKPLGLWLDKQAFQGIKDNVDPGLRRQLPFLESLFRDARGQYRHDLLRHANADQINAISELVLNTLKGHARVTPDVLARLKRHKKVLRELAKRKNSVTRRRALLLRQTGSGLWRGLQAVCRCLQR